MMGGNNNHYNHYKHYNQYNAKYDVVSKKKAKRRIKSSVVNKITTIAVIICSIIIISTGVLSFLTRGTIEPNKAKLEGKYGHMEIAKITEIPKSLQDAVIAIEDKRFYSHRGVDIFGLGRAFVKNIVTGSKEGGSTIEMQISKNLLTSQEQTYTRKLQDIKIASQMNKKMSKEDILEVYLNSIYLGKGATGVKSGARIYFGKDISELNLAECAMLAGITKHPTKYSVYTTEPITLKDKKDALSNKLIFSTLITDKDKPVEEKVVEKLNKMNLLTNSQYNKLKQGKIKVEKAVLNPEAVKRQQIVLKVMKSQRYITKKEYEKAINAEIIITTSLK